MSKKKNKTEQNTPKSEPKQPPRSAALVKRLLYLIVLLSGGSLMALELVGSRIISPVYGSSMYTWGSLIGIFMLALSLGYFFGGKLADKMPRFSTLTIVLSISGLLVVAIPFYSLSICESFVHFGQKWGSCLSSLVLFGPPSILMGIVSPLAIRLQAKEIESVGGVAGSLYSVSTIGSIAGTFLTSFWLLELAGVSTLTKGIGVTLLLTAVISLLLLSGKKGVAKNVAAVIALVFFFGGGFQAVYAESPLPIRLRSDHKLLASCDSAYNTMFVIDSPEERCLQFNESRESGFYLSSPYLSSFDYTAGTYYSFGYNQDIKNVLLIGGGGAALPIEYLCCLKKEVLIDSVEIDDAVIRYSQEFFIDYALERFEEEGINDQIKRRWAERIKNNINLITADGRLFLTQCGKKYDLIIIDAYLGGRIPFHLTTKEFFADVHRCLSDRGVMAMNIISGVHGETNKVFRGLHDTVSLYFPGIMIIPIDDTVSYSRTSSVEAFVKSRQQPHNMIFVCPKSKDEVISGSQLVARMRTLMSRGFFDAELNHKIKHVESFVGDVEEQQRRELEYFCWYYPPEETKKINIPPMLDKDNPLILSDEYSPVDIWSGVIKLYSKCK